MTSRIRGATRLAVEATREVTTIVQDMHVAIGGGPPILGSPLAGVVKLVTAPVYGSIRAITALVGMGLERAFDVIEAVLPPSSESSTDRRDAVIAAANGVVGDYLHEQGNPLAIQMQLAPRGEPTGKLVVLVHGSSMAPHQWLRAGHDHGAALARDLGMTPIYVRYNSGLHISTNGAELARQLDALVATWPVPVEEIVLLGHSMGGLVARSACLAAEANQLAWRTQVRALVTLGTPHHGAPLERGGSWLHWALGIHRYSAPLARLARLRSAGVTDLRHGYVLDEHWQGRDRFAIAKDPRASIQLPAQVSTYVVAGTLSAADAKSLRSDGLVPVDSALGHHADEALAFALPDAHRFTAHGVGHIDLLSSPDVYAALKAWLA